MRNYEVTFVVDPVLSGDELKATADKYINFLKAEGCTIVHVDEMGLRPLAYTINKRASGVYYCVEYSAPNGDMNVKFELQLRRDEQMLRFLTVSLDKFGVKYNEDKRAGKIAAARKVGKVAKKPGDTPAPAPSGRPDRGPRPAPKTEVPAAVAVEAPVAEPIVEAVVEAPAIVEATAPVTEVVADATPTETAE
jgi:small subunit ribosomal protein S6